VISPKASELTSRAVYLPPLAIQTKLVTLLACFMICSFTFAQTNNPSNKAPSSSNTTQSKVQVNQRNGIKAPKKTNSQQSNKGTLADSNKKESAPDYGANNYELRIERGCIRNSFANDKLPSNIGIDNAIFSNYFKNQTSTFFRRTQGFCIPYVVAYGKNNALESLSIMNGFVRNQNSQILTFTPSVFGGFLTQETNLIDQMKKWGELFVPLRDVLYETQRLSDRLPVELAWELNSVVRQIYSEKPNTSDLSDIEVRVIVDFGDRDRWAQIWAVELIDSKNKEVLADAFWLDRNDIPGGFFTSSGESLERSFWTNPLSYRRISRGVGTATVTRKKTTIDPNTSEKVTVNVKSYITHIGIDYAAPTGTPIFSVADGKITYLGYNGGYGNLIVIEHPGNYQTYYAHLSSYNVELQKGGEIRRGMEIGYVGSTGRSTGPHLHFELRKNGIYIDPYSPKNNLDLWTLRNSDAGNFTQNILLLGNILKP